MAIPEQKAVLPTVSVIIPTFARVNQLEESVRSVLVDPGTTECLVSIDGSRDGSFELAQRLSQEDSRVIPLFNEHSGKHGTVRAALAVAKGDLILLIDDDVVAGPGLVTGHARHHVSRNDLVVMGYTPCVPPKKRSSVRYVTRLYDREYEQSCLEIEAEPDLLLTRLWGGNVSIRRENLLRVRLRIPNFAHEDTDFGLRCLQVGYVGVFDRNLYAEHHHERSARGFLRGARAFGAGRWLVHYDHADIVGPYRSKWNTDKPWTLARLLFLVGKFPTLAHGLAVISLFIGWTATKCHLESVESVAYRLARNLELEVGATLVSRLDESEIADRSQALPAIP